MELANRLLLMRSKGGTSTLTVPDDFGGYLQVNDNNNLVVTRTQEGIGTQSKSLIELTRAKDDIEKVLSHFREGKAKKQVRETLEHLILLSHIHEAAGEYIVFNQELKRDYSPLNRFINYSIKEKELPLKPSFDYLDTCSLMSTSLEPPTGKILCQVYVADKDEDRSSAVVTIGDTYVCIQDLGRGTFHYLHARDELGFIPNDEQAWMYLAYQLIYAVEAYAGIVLTRSPYISTRYNTGASLTSYSIPEGVNSVRLVTRIYDLINKQ